MSKKTKVIIATSVLSIAAIAGISIGATSVLFSKDATSNIHITSGSLDVGFYLTDLMYDTIKDGALVVNTVNLTEYTGYEEYKSGKSGVNLKKYTDSFNVDKLFPSFKGEATFVVLNDSDMPVKLKFENKINKDKCLKSDGVTKFTETELEMFKLSNDYLTEETISGKSEKTIVVTIGLDYDAGNDYMSSTFDFDVHVTATQALSRL